jgi:hypothetical protein
MHTLTSLDEIELALNADVDGLIVSEDLLKNERLAKKMRRLISDAENNRKNDE